MTLDQPIGLIPVDLEGGQLNISQNQPKFGPVINKPKELAQALSLTLNYLADYPVEIVSTGLPSVIMAVKGSRALVSCAVNQLLFGAWLRETADCNVLVFTEEKKADSLTLRVRVFVNDTGYFEDPATGSANGNLAAYLLKHGIFGRNNIEYQVKQGFEMKRPSRLNISAEFNQGVFKIRVGGRVQPVAAGKWF